MKNLKSNFIRFLNYFSKKWNEAGEIQKQIDEVKFKNQELLHRYPRTWK